MVSLNSFCNNLKKYSNLSLSLRVSLPIVIHLWISSYKTSLPVKQSFEAHGPLVLYSITADPCVNLTVKIVSVTLLGQYT